MLRHQYVPNCNLRRVLCDTEKQVVFTQPSSPVSQVRGICVTQSYRERTLVSRSNNTTLSLTQPCIFASSLYRNTAKKPLSRMGSTSYYSTLMSSHYSYTGASTGLQFLDGQQNRRRFSTKFKSINHQEVLNSLSEQLDEILDASTQQPISLNFQKLLEFIESSSSELSVLASRNKNISYEIFSFVGEKVTAILSHVSAEIKQNSTSSDNSADVLFQKAFIGQIVNLILTKYLAFNFSIANQCLQLTHLNSDSASSSKTGTNETQGLSIEAMASILKYNPERVKSSWEFFLDFVTQHDLLKLMKENRISSNDFDKENASDLMNTLVFKLLSEHDAESVSESKPLSIKQLTKIIFVLLNFKFKVSDTNKTTLLSEFARANIASTLFLSGLNIEQICTPIDITVFLKRGITDSQSNKGHVNEVNLYSKKADLVESLRLLKHNDETLLNESLKVLSNDHINALDGLLKLLSEIRNPAYQPKECKEESTVVAQIYVNLRSIGNFLAPTSNELILSLKVDAHQSQLYESASIVHRAAENQLRYVINSLGNIHGSSPISQKSEQIISTEELSNKILLYLALDLNDFKTASANFHQLISQKHFNHDKARFTMLKICAIKALEAQKEVPWMNIAESMIPGCVNTFTANIDTLSNNPADIKSDLVKEEIYDVVRVVRALILLYGGFDLDRSIDLFNMNVENFKKLDSIQKKIVTSGINDMTGAFSQQDGLTEHSNCYYLVDSLIKAALWNNERELAYVIYDKSIENRLVTKDSELTVLKKNFKKFGEHLEDAESGFGTDANKCQATYSKFKQFVIQHIRSI